MWVAILVIFAFFTVMAILVYLWSRGVMTARIDQSAADAAMTKDKALLAAWWAEVKAWRAKR